MLPLHISHQAALRPAVGLGGVEPPTSRLSGVRSNHLSYSPMSCPRGAVATSLIERTLPEPFSLEGPPYTHLRRGAFLPPERSFREHARHEMMKGRSIASPVAFTRFWTINQPTRDWHRSTREPLRDLWSRGLFRR